MLKRIVILLLIVKCATLNAQTIEPQPLNKNINTFLNEYWPTISADDKTLIFTRLIEQNGVKNEDFYYSERDSLGIWQETLPLSSLNTQENEGAQTISADGRFMVFTSCNNRNSFGSCDLFYSLKIGDRWLPARNLGSSINTKYWETQPALSADGTELYFVSNRPSGKGGMDIWHSKLQGIDEEGNMHWSKPTNLNINTSGSEMSPFIHYDNETLYFSSNGYTKEEQQDIYVSRKIGANFSEPQNIGKPINTEADEVGFVVNATGSTGYFASNRAANNRDIYSCPLPQNIRPKEVQILKGKIQNTKDGNPLMAVLSLYALKDSISTYNTLSSFDSGDYLLCLTKGKKWQLSIQSEGHLFHSEIIDLEKDSIFKNTKNIQLSPIEKNAILRLKNIFFDTDKATLKAASIVELTNIKHLLLQHPTLIIELAGHTDSQGSDEYNQRLSENRAKTVYQWLTQNGISENRLFPKGYGESRPVTTNNTSVGRTKNRRTELKVIAY